MALAPHFLIVGAPKCGTTALYSYLSTHPAIAMSSKKSPGFWCTDLRLTDPVTDPNDYLRCWEGAPADALRGEASTDYLRSERAIPAVLRDRPDARFIAMIRNPVRMAAAYHSQLFFTSLEKVWDFEKAWCLQGLRRQGIRIPPGTIEPRNLQFESVCALGDQLERFCALVSAERRLIIVFDDLIADPRAVYQQTLSFLGLPDDGRQTFERMNENKVYRSPRLTVLHREVPRWLGPLYQPLRTVAAHMGIGPSRIVNRFNMTTGPRLPLRPEFEAELIQIFQPQVEKIEALLGRDLSHWKQPGTTS